MKISGIAFSIIIRKGKEQLFSPKNSILKQTLHHARGRKDIFRYARTPIPLLLGTCLGAVFKKNEGIK